MTDAPRSDDRTAVKDRWFVEHDADPGYTRVYGPYSKAGAELSADGLRKAEERNVRIWQHPADIRAEIASEDAPRRDDPTELIARVQVALREEDKQVLGGPSRDRCIELLREVEPALAARDQEIATLTEERDMFRRYYEAAHSDWEQAEATVQQLTQERDAWKNTLAFNEQCWREEREAAITKIFRLRDGAEACAARLQQLEAALIRYGEHRHGCRSKWRAATGSSDIGACDCGLDAALTVQTPGAEG